MGPGANGSWRWSDVELLVAQGPDRAQRRTTGPGASGAIEPLAAVGMLLPSGVTNGSGGGPSHGASTRASWPMARSTRASPSTWRLHAARDGEAVGAHQADAQTTREPYLGAAGLPGRSPLGVH